MFTSYPIRSSLLLALGFVLFTVALPCGVRAQQPGVDVNKAEEEFSWSGAIARQKEELGGKILRGIMAAPAAGEPVKAAPGKEATPSDVRAAPKPEFIQVQNRDSRAQSRRDRVAAATARTLEGIADSGVATPETPAKDTTGANPEGGAADPTTADGGTEINVKNAELESVIRIFSKKTKRNYILDERVKGKVSIFLPGKISPDESIRILDSVLALKGFTAVPIGENIWKIIPSKDAKQSTIPTLREPSDSPTATMVTRLLPLKFVSAEDVKQVITPLVTSDGLVNAYTGTNSLIIIDLEDNIERIVEIVDSLDVPFSDRDMIIIPVLHADATELAQKLQEILGEKDGSAQGGSAEATAIDLIRARVREAAAARGVPQPPSGAGSAGSPAASSATSGTIAARGRAPKIIPDQRTNSIIVVADEDMAARIRALISQLDSKVDLSGNRFYVYRCQHAKADDLAGVLGGMVSSTGSSGPGSSSSSSSLGSSSSQQSSMNRSSLSSAGSRRTGAPSLSDNRTGSSARGNSNFSFGENVSITADPATNSLIISAGKADYQKILALLEKLDIKRRQVLVEAMLLEVGIDDSSSFGTEFITSAGGEDGGILAKSDFGGITQLLSDPTGLSNFSVAAASSGSLSIGDDITIPSQTILLTAAQQNSNVNVLSAPNVLATDNEQAEIIVGQNVPFLSSTSTSETNLNNTFNQVDRQDVGITLRITPQISSNEFVTLRIFTEVSNVILATLNSNLGPTTTKRASETTVITKNGQMVVIGGLMSDDVTSSESGVPFLKDVPVLGTLFRTTSEQRRRTNLLIFITPRIVKDQFDARDVTIEGRDEMGNAISALDSYPERREVLRNNAIDRVAETSAEESEDGEGSSSYRVRTDIGTIYVPKMKSDPASSGSASSSNTGPLTGSAAPSLPGVNRKDVRIEEPRASAGPLEGRPLSGGVSTGFADSSAQVTPSKGRYVVMQARSEDLPRLKDISSRLPFPVELGAGLVGILVPNDGVGAGKSSSFAVGSVYGYRFENDEIGFDVVGTFTSAEDAAELYSSFSGDSETKWYTLSPHELMALSAPTGSGSKPAMFSPWKRVG